MNDRDAAPESPLRRAGFVLALVGFVSSAVVHVVSLFGVALLGPDDGLTLMLHGGAMALAAPLIFTGVAHAPLWPLNARMRFMLRDAPPWGERVFQLFFLNALVHLGALVLVGRQVARDEPLSLPQGTRVFSAFWMAIFALCAMAWWPAGPRWIRPSRSSPRS